MTPLNEFVRAVLRAVREGVGPTWMIVASVGNDYYIYHVGGRWGGCSYVCMVYPDGSAQLLSRDEDECRLFATLWELEK